MNQDKLADIIRQQTLGKKKNLVEKIASTIIRKNKPITIEPDLVVESNIPNIPVNNPSIDPIVEDNKSAILDLSDEIPVENRPTRQIRKIYGRSRITSVGQGFINSGLIDKPQLKEALDYQKQHGSMLGDTLVILGYITEDDLVHFLHDQLKIDIADSDLYSTANKELVAQIPEYLAKDNKLIVLKEDAEFVYVAMHDPTDVVIIDQISNRTGKKVVPLLGKPSQIETAIKKYYQEINAEAGAESLISEMADEDDSSLEFIEEEEEDIDLNNLEKESEGQVVVKLVSLIFNNAVKAKASDIHIEPSENSLSIRYRIDGNLKKIMSPPKKTHMALISRIKILSNLDIAERRIPQDGRMVVKLPGHQVDIRVSILPTIHGEKAVMRLLDKDAFDKSTENLGFGKHEMDIFTNWISKPHGMILVTGPTGSGKSTTLYSAVNFVKSEEVNILTVEDPVEFQMDGITQVQVNTKANLTFGAALRSFLRQDPDIVLIGEIRDNETADIAIKMSLTGHLVFSTLHTNDAASAITRYVDIGVPPILIGSALNLIIAQRLVRRICTNCKEEFIPSKELLEQLHLDDDKENTFYKGKGCVSCNNTGYSGRAGIFEMLEISPEIRKLIYKNASSLEIKELAVKQGMKTLRDQGLVQAQKGVTTLDQILAITMMD